jgi:hypothetical protein
MKGITRAEMDVNKKIHEWLGKCWHDFGSNPECKTSAERYYCPKCGAFSWDGHDKHPNYTTDPAACLELIEAVRAKAKGAVITTSVWNCYGCEIKKDFLDKDGFSGKGDTLPAAVAQAVSKLIDATADGNDGRKDE